MELQGMHHSTGSVAALSSSIAQREVVNEAQRAVRERASGHAAPTVGAATSQTSFLTGFTGPLLSLVASLSPAGSLVVAPTSDPSHAPGSCASLSKDSAEDDLNRELEDAEDYGRVPMEHFTVNADEVGDDDWEDVFYIRAVLHYHQAMVKGLQHGFTCPMSPFP
ncbi:hypothetical protein BD413DRAFT_610990 [Trametes elegans]|nr:hypothetical protein BD413DRAFT_610990 [Trametes elegans]